MSEKVGVVGSRQGADLDHVRSFVRALHERQPDTTLVSGGGGDVDNAAEQEWLRLGGRVQSFRPVQLPDDSYGVELWDLGGEQPMKFLLTQEPTWANFASAANYRDMLIAEAVQRLVVFYRRGKSRGAEGTAFFARVQGREVYEYERA